jgi:rRNA maturation protein Nop10
MVKLTREQVDRYYKGGASHCPFCGSEDLAPSETVISDAAATQRVRCLGCNEGWHDVYTLTAVCPEDGDDVMTSAAERVFGD